MISEVKTSNISVFARKYSILRSCIREWRKDEKNISEVLKSQTKSCTSKIDGTRNTITKFRLAGRGRKVLDQNMEISLFEWLINHRFQGSRITGPTFKEKPKNLLHLEIYNKKVQNCLSKNYFEQRLLKIRRQLD